MREASRRKARIAPCSESVAPPGSQAVSAATRPLPRPAEGGGTGPSLPARSCSRAPPTCRRLAHIDTPSSSPRESGMRSPAQLVALAAAVAAPQALECDYPSRALRLLREDRGSAARRRSGDRPRRVRLPGPPHGAGPGEPAHRDPGEGPGAPAGVGPRCHAGRERTGQLHGGRPRPRLLAGRGWHELPHRRRRTRIG
jgi:hypothetical protein